MNNQDQIEADLIEIVNVWNNYILKYKEVQKRINFSENRGVNFFGDIIKYFNDTLIILALDLPIESNYYENFANAIAFLQALYVQQDLIVEMLFIFGCNEFVKDLKNDQDYYLNREIRNELVGHPIRRKPHSKEDNSNKFISSSIFSNDQKTNNIAYIRYHESNRFNGEIIELERSIILNRHSRFLLKNLSIIKKKAFKLLPKFRSTLYKFLTTIENAHFERLVNRVDHIFENFYYSQLISNKKDYVDIFNKMNKNIRYKRVIELFYKELKYLTIETIIEIDLILKKTDEKLFAEYQLLKKYKTSGNSQYNYELTKLVDKDRLAFDLLFEKLSENSYLIEELKYLHSQINNNVEYFVSYLYLNDELRNGST